ncbi:hypothetical protein [Sphingomonas sp. Leaf343]|uniref:hypothetical protein n=1 Tax=Sphingomonas sp. Leaf343 TaxID=1736345 RepID=UPI000700B0B7|nr:hypothetical protein [Sphingomonas sp. Leaf343]KQR88141.1 hypothetical protein ASG07_01535 [Sphingomonas sp. Leaf343]
MSDDAAFYRNRAIVERTNSEAATLQNVKDRCDRAASTWEQMAVRAERTQVMRAQREGAKTSAEPARDMADAEMAEESAGA